nr:MAG TPA: hypothetical protein [Caudoviricetes sp.]
MTKERFYGIIYLQSKTRGRRNGQPSPDSGNA